MKFFTQNLLERFASEDDEVAIAAQDELEELSDKYRKHLTSIQKKLPARFVEMQDNFYLHDATVLGSSLPWFNSTLLDFTPQLNSLSIRFQGPNGNSSIFIELQLDSPPQEVLVLHYRMVSLTFEPYDFLPMKRLSNFQWQHDEVEVDLTGKTPEFNHSILFTNGAEITINFKDFDYATMKPFASEKR